MAHLYTDQLTNAKVVDQHGRPWQEAGGYESGIAVPHVLQVSSLVQSSWQTYMHGRADEATRNDPDFARAMRRDAKIEGPLEERYLGTASLEWHLEVDDDKDPKQKAVKDNLTKVAKSTYRLQEMIMSLSEAIWYGKYGAQLVYENRPFMFTDMNGQKVRGIAPAIRYHEPVHGDSIGFKWDRTPYILVNAERSSDIPNASIIMANKGRGLELKGSFRSRFIIHHHRTRAADFNDIDRLEAIHGVGVRDVLFWTHWLRNEWLGNIADWCERTGLGVRVWYYQMGNKASKEAVEDAAKKQSDRTNLLIPRSPNQTGKSAESVEFVDTTGTGAELLLKLISHLEEIEERYLIGQSLSSKTEGSGLGGTGVASLHADTKSKIIAFDANNLAETLTEDWIRPLRQWMYPSEDVQVRWVFDIEKPDPEKVLNACNTAYSMGVELVEDKVRELTGTPAPQPGDKVLKQQSPMMGMPGDPDDPTQQLFGDDQPQEDDFASMFDEMGGENVDQPAFAAAAQ